MDLRLLRTFVVAARLLNFHQTADRLYLAQPTVTAHIRQLETLMRTALFERTGKRVRLTAAGERFLPLSLQVLEKYDEAVQEFTAWRQGYQSSLHILSSPLVAASTVPGMLKAFTRDHPALEVKVATMESPDILPLLTAGNGDVGLSRMTPWNSDLDSFVLYNDEVVLVAGRTQEEEPPAWQTLFNHQPLIIHNHPVYWEDLLLHLEKMEIPLRTMAVSHVHVTKKLIQEGLGISFLPVSTVQEELAEGVLRCVQTPELELPMAATHVVYPARRPLSPACEAFIETVRELYLDAHGIPLTFRVQQDEADKAAQPKGY